ncbi:MAG: hypothetical protein NTY15_17150 [Planctomycetota bacterium]|nr:hypothetical protein [Planctomycetota bacterium]
MATVTSPTTSQYIQQAFNWDELESKPVMAKTPADDCYTAVAARSGRSTNPMTVPTYSTSSSTRRGRCEHVGGILASVLERYGIGIDELIAEIDGLKQSSRHDSLGKKD